MPLLEVRDLSVRFGGVVALDRVSFNVDEGQVIALIGPNGAGKTTLFNVITRVYRPSGGTALFDGHSVLEMRPHHVIRFGVTRTFQNVALFRSMTVLDNVMVGDHVHIKSGWFEAGVPLPRAVATESASRKRALEMIEFVGLEDYTHRPVAALPFGIRKRVALARALVSRPPLILLADPAGGLSHAEVDSMSRLLRRCHAELKVTMLL